MKRQNRGEPEPNNMQINWPFSWCKCLKISIALLLLTCIGGQTEHSRLVNCMEDYVDNLRDIFGFSYALFARTRMLEMMTAPPIELAKNSNVIFGIGPGTSGTRSLFLAFKLLNVTGRHSWDSSLGCATNEKLRELISLDFNIFEKSPPLSLFWGDHPVPSYWWRFYFQFPQARFIMTDIDDNFWYTKRLKDHCNRHVGGYWDHCTAPLAFLLPYGTPTKEPFHNRPDTDVFKEMYYTSHLLHVSAENNSALFEHYRHFARCVIPEDRLLWLNMAELPASREFWTRLVEFSGLKVEKGDLEMMIEAGVPHVGTKDCKIGAHLCHVAHFRDQEGPHRTVFPNICFNSTTATQ